MMTTPTCETCGRDARGILDATKIRNYGVCHDCLIASRKAQNAHWRRLGEWTAQRSWARTQQCERQVREYLQSLLRGIFP